MNYHQTASNSPHPPVIAGASTDGESWGFFDYMKTYSEKLKDPRWQAFRQCAIDFYGEECTSCAGNDTSPGVGIHIHHKRYIRDHEPWEYDLEDVTVICGTCHNEIHDCETKWRDMIRAMPAYMIQEFDSMAEAFKGMDINIVSTWASYCKNQARALKGFKRHENQNY